MNSMFDDLLNDQEFNRAKSNEFEHYASLFRKNFTLSNQQSNDLVTYSSLGSIDNIKLKKNTLELLKEPKKNIDNSLTKIELIKSANLKLENRYKLGYSVFFKDIDEVNSMANSNINLMKKNNKKEKELLKNAEKKIIQDNITTGVTLIAIILFLRNNPDILKYILADLASA